MDKRAHRELLPNFKQLPQTRVWGSCLQLRFEVWTTKSRGLLLRFFEKFGYFFSDVWGDV